MTRRRSADAPGTDRHAAARSDFAGDPPPRADDAARSARGFSGRWRAIRARRAAAAASADASGGREWRALAAGLALAPAVLTAICAGLAGMVSWLELAATPLAPAEEGGVARAVASEIAATFGALLPGFAKTALLGAAPVAAALWALQLRSRVAFAIGGVVLAALLAVFADTSSGEGASARVFLSALVAIALMQTTLSLARWFAGPAAPRAP